MVVKKKLKKGRPLTNFKIRNIKGITPKGFKIKEINVKINKIIFKRK